MSSNFFSKQLKAEIQADLTKQLKKPPTVTTTEDMGTLKHQHRRQSMTATLTMSLKTMEQFDTEVEQHQKTRP